MKHQVKLRSEVYVSNRLFGVVVKTTTESVWIKEDEAMLANQGRNLKRVLGLEGLPYKPTKPTIEQWQLGSDGLWFRLENPDSRMMFNFRLNSLVEFTFG